MSRPHLLPGLSLRAGDMLDGLFRVGSLIDAERAVVRLSGSQVADGAPVMIQILVAGGPSAELARVRFVAGVRKASALKGPHVARVLDVGVTPEGHPYVVREAVPTQSLATLLERCASLSTQEATELALDVCDALAEAHRHGLLHGDLGLRSIHLAWSAGPTEVKVIDLGIGAAVAAIGLQASTIEAPALHLRAPEQLQPGGQADVRSDVWAVGALLYTMLAGVPPFAAETPSRISVAVENDEPDALAGVPDALADLVEACLAKDPAERPATIGGLAEALAAFSPRAGASLTRIRAHAAPLPKPRPIETAAAAMPAFLLERESERQLRDSAPTIVARRGYESFAHRASVPGAEIVPPRPAPPAPPESALEIPIVVELPVLELPKLAKTLETTDTPRAEPRLPEPSVVVAKSVPPMVIERDLPTMIVPRRRLSWKVAGVAIAAASVAVGVVVGGSSAKLARRPSSQSAAISAPPPAAVALKDLVKEPAQQQQQQQQPAVASTPATELPPAPVPPSALRAPKPPKATARSTGPLARPVDPLVHSAPASLQPEPKANDDDLRRFIDDRR